MEKPLDFQSIMMKLQHFWDEQDCLIWQPYYSQVGAGTMNPATFLRVLGPEPWKVAYVEPSIRPDDGRYGDNPNRLHQFYQFQVIMKPSPEDIQGIYLNSLQALGIDPAKHDIRFVEDNWQQPAIGAWGLGWEVWLDGQEITQFTYFQQCGGLDLSPVSVEITYGLERIAMTLQGVRHFKDIQWSPERTYGDVNLMGEYEHSTYYFDAADIGRMRRMYELYEEEAKLAIEAGLVLPAHDYVLKTSHTFNILDTRGAVSVTERQSFFKKTRQLARRVAELYVEQRQDAEFPWLSETGKGFPAEGASKIALPEAESLDFLLEIGTEELPPSDLDAALTQLREAVPQMLEGLKLSHGEIQVEGTPRRLVIFVSDLATRQPDLDLEIKGPPAARAFDDDGSPTRAAEGFARSKGVEVADLVTKAIDGGEYVVAQVHEHGEPALVVLHDALSDLIAGIRFTKSMRWNASEVAFSRPIRWILALHGTQVVPLAFAGYTSGRLTHGLRFELPAKFDVQSPQDYFDKLLAQGIILDVAERKANIKKQVEALAQAVGGRIPEDPALLAEVTHLVEKPTAMRGEFDPAYLDILPPAVLISVMKKHQRYFPVVDDKGNLMHYFIAVRNGGEEHLDIVVDGNEQVVLARFADAEFFIREDLKKDLEDFVSQLSTLTFQKKLGSYLQKTERITRLSQWLAGEFSLTKSETTAALRAAHLCKADLVTNMVVEMTSLQGVMGRYYALHSGEEPAVAEAIFEHYLPRSAEEGSPRGVAGFVVGLADRLDSLIGLFSEDMAPTGTKDPFAQRRAAIGLCQNLMAWEKHFDLRQALAEAAACLEKPVPSDVQSACFEFILGRLRGMLLDQGYRYDIVDAVLAEKGQNPFGALKAIQSLTDWVSREDWDEILAAFSRCVRITRDLEQVFAVDPALLAEPSEKALLTVLHRVEAAIAGQEDVDSFFEAFITMIPDINQFFDEILVMAEDEDLRKTRLGLLQKIAALSKGIADLSYLEGF